jgi:hypothetical protein
MLLFLAPLALILAGVGYVLGGNFRMYATVIGIIFGGTGVLWLLFP